MVPERPPLWIDVAFVAGARGALSGDAGILSWGVGGARAGSAGQAWPC
jgi:hypothetical protein